ncbi:MMPL family transporter [Actinacidiphila acididurans]|uniref:MMPL family transporter n=1 Tax=Actinacidiphila acididurans TaxID=2784346 RepID=A0ABS2TTX4_9ACTN|nr:MMPL family transporter [Actinacidiphila acididurans]MBM9506790.1 MMPL family transporter [Actinacidiphila acididurans]
MSTLLYRLARWCFQHRRRVLAVWFVLVIAVIGVAQASGGKTSDTFTIPGTESQRATSVLKKDLPAASGGSTQVVFAAGSDITAARYEKAIDTAVTELGTLPQVATVANPYRAGTVSPDKRIALATVSYMVQAGDVKNSTVDGLGPAVRAARSAGLQVEFSGTVYPKPGNAASPELVGLAVALIILLLTFGSLVCAGMPIVTALFGVVISMMGMTALAAVTDIASAATSVGAMLGISCGIDYALFILSRYRTHLLAGHHPREAAGRAAGTAGSSVVFAALSVVIALCGLAVAGIPFLTTMGLAAAGSVLVALLIALTLLPAAFGFAGPRAARFSRLPVLRRALPATRTAVEGPEKLTGTRWATWVVRHRVAVLVTGVIALGVLALPTAHMDLGLPGAGSRPTSDTSRRAYDLTSEHLGVGYNGTLSVVAENITRTAQAQQIATSLGKVPGVATASVATITHRIALISVVPTTGPNDPATTDLVHHIRDDRTAIEGDSGTRILVGGPTATNIDVSTKLGNALPAFLITVVSLAFILLTFAFRTILVPIKSIIGFLLSVGASFGAEVAVFQWGWFKDVFGIDKSQSLSFLPIIVLAIVFGLSSDYEVFVVSRIKEHFTRHGDARQAVIVGTGQSARVVTAAALIMAAVFASFLFTPDPMIKSIGFSFAVGVLIDAFVVRLTLVPAAMAIAGKRIWYHPRWYGRLVPDPDIEGEQLERHLAQHREPTTV